MMNMIQSTLENLRNIIEMECNEVNLIDSPELRSALGLSEGQEVWYNASNLVCFTSQVKTHLLNSFPHLVECLSLHLPAFEGEMFIVGYRKNKMLTALLSQPQG